MPAAPEGGTRARRGAVEETWTTATGESTPRVRDAGTSIDAGRGGGGARWAPRPGWTVNEENTIHPGRYFIYHPGSRPPGPSDPLRAARISQYIPSQSGSPHTAPMAPHATARFGREEIIFLRVQPDGNARLLACKSACGFCCRHRASSFCRARTTCPRPELRLLRGSALAAYRPRLGHPPAPTSYGSFATCCVAVVSKKQRASRWLAAMAFRFRRNWHGLCAPMRAPHAGVWLRPRRTRRRGGGKSRRR